MKKIKIGVIGAGNMGKNHIRLLSEMRSEFDLCGVFDIDEEKVRKIGYGGKVFASVELLLSSVDAAIIAVPSFLHKEMALKASEYKVNLLVEKPLALNANDATQICDAYKTLDAKILLVGHVERFNPVVQELEKILKNEKIIAVDIERCSPADRRISDTDVIYDLMIHDVDILLNAIQPNVRFKKLYAFGRTVYNERNVDYAQAIFKFDNNVQASITASRATEDKIRKIKVHCEDAFIDCDLLHRGITITRKTHYKLDTGYSPVYKQENVLERVFVPNIEPLKAELLYFADCIRNGKALNNTGEIAERDLLVLDKIKERVYDEM